MKKYTCPECGEVYYDKKPRVCKKCGCPSKEFQVVELVEVPANEPAPAPQAAPQSMPQPAPQPMYAPQQPTYAAPQPAQEPYRITISSNRPAGAPMTIERFMNGFAVLLLLFGLAYGLYELINGCIDIEKENKLIREMYGGYNSYDYIRNVEVPHISVAPAVFKGMGLIFFSIMQFGIIRMFVKISKRLHKEEKKD